MVVWFEINKNAKLDGLPIQPFETGEVAGL
jgi:hypothetical protein